MDPFVSQAPLPKRHPFLIFGVKASGSAGTTSMCGVSMIRLLIFPEGLRRRIRFCLPGRTFILFDSIPEAFAKSSR
ncbi:MAG: hypothetical protein EBS13_07225 [Verrucomicrobia bacterium]|nr:hypothetical protein [Verrucomicrobiota bacterium]